MKMKIAPRLKKLSRRDLTGLCVVPLLVLLTSGLALLMELPFRNSNHVIIYLLVVIVAAVRWGMALACYAFGLSSVAIVYFFVPPRYSFNLEFNQRNYLGYLPGLLAFLTLSLFLSYLITALQRERDRARSLVEQERAARKAALEATNQFYKEREWASGVEERNHLARDLHDGLAQSINYIGLKAQLVRKLYETNQTEQVLQEVERLSRAAELARADIREVLYGLRHTQNDRPFILELTDLIHNLADLSEIKVNFSHSEAQHWPTLSITTQTQLLRIAQEALANVQKHSKAYQVWVEACFEPETRAICISIKDDGVGFEPEKVDPNSTHHLGLEIMRERAERIKADLQISSQPGQGSKVSLKHRPRATSEPRLQGAANAK